MAHFTHSVVAQNETVTADTQVSYDLPVAPLSHILITLKFAQNLADESLNMLNVLELMDRVEVLYKGTAIYSMSGFDAFAAGIFIPHFESWGVNADGNDDDERSFTWCVPMTRFLYSPVEAFPVSRRGELVLQITYAAAFTDIDTVRAQIESVELPGASPERYLKMTTYTSTPTATGEWDIELPIGNVLSDIILFGTTVPAANADTATIEQLELRVNNRELYYSRTNFETLHNMAGRLRAAPGYWGSHVHRLVEAAYAQWDDTSENIPADHKLHDYLHLPIDVLRDGLYALDTKGATAFVLRIVAGDTNAIRAIPCELVAAQGGV